MRIELWIIRLSVLRPFGAQIGRGGVPTSDANPSLFHEKKTQNAFFFPKILTKEIE